MPYQITRHEFDRIASSDGARSTGRDSAVVRCPAHNDGRPSLSISYERGKFLCNCFAGCDFEDIIANFKNRGFTFSGGHSKKSTEGGRYHSDSRGRRTSETALAGESASSFQQQTKLRDNGQAYAGEALGNTGDSGQLPLKPISTREKPLRAHVYRDERGNPRYRKAKYSTGWRTEHFGDDGELYSGMGGNKPIPYKLPELVQAIQKRKTILIHEGEKDADSTNERSDGTIFATTTGSATSWSESFVGLFKVPNPPKVVIIGDEDEPSKSGERPGEIFARSVIDSFLKAGLPVARFRLPRYFSGAKIKDISDFYQAGGTFAHIKRCVQNIHVLSGFETSPAGQNITVGNILERLSWPKEDERPILPGVFELGSVVQLVGASKAKKSFFSQQLALSAALGVPFLDFMLKTPRRVLYLNYELESRWINRRFGHMVERLQVDCSSNFANLIIADMEMSLPSIEVVEAMAKEYQPEMLIIDPIYPLIAGEEKETTSWHNLLHRIKVIARGSNCAVLYVHHDPKGDSSQRKLVDRGSGSSIQARHFDAGIYLGPHINEKHTILEVVPRNYAPLPAQTISFDRGAFIALPDVPAEPPDPRARKQKTEIEQYFGLVEKIVADATRERAGIRYADLLSLVMKETGVGGNRAKKMIREACESGNLNADKRGRTTIYKVDPFSDDDLF